MAREVSKYHQDGLNLSPLSTSVLALSTLAFPSKKKKKNPLVIEQSFVQSHLPC